jgi:hypothetical protein
MTSAELAKLRIEIRNIIDEMHQEKVEMLDLLKEIQANLAMSAVMERYASGLWEELNEVIHKAEGNQAEAQKARA